MEGKLKNHNWRLYGRQLYTLFPLLYLVLAATVVFVVQRNGTFPGGSDTMYHVYRGDVVYQALRGGNLWPNYNEFWYNGVELLRYWPPFPAYYFALCEWIGGGNLFYGYLVYIGSICFLGALPWLWIGQKQGRPLLGGFLGALWFFIPNNLLAMFQEGNLARSLSMVFLPLLLYFVNSYLLERRWGYLPAIIISFALITCCHVGYAGMVALSVLLFFLCRLMIARRGGGMGAVLTAMALGFALTGVWTVSSLVGGITSGDSSEVMASTFQKLSVTLNPFDRSVTGNANFYFGLSAFLLAVFGLFTGRKAAAPGFAAGVLICLSTSTAAYWLLRLLPGSQFLWMVRFISIGVAFVLLGLMYWKSLKTPVTLLFCALLALDTIPSLSLVYGFQTGESAAIRFDQMQESSLIKKGQEVTTQRMALMDESTLGATGAFLVSGWGDVKPANFGAGREAATTVSNIIQINRSMIQGKFLYLFDRALELGSDTVLIQNARLPQGDDTIEKLDAAASRLHFELVEENSAYRLYHCETGAKNWGTVSRYPAIGIGSAAASISLDFPALEETTSTNLNDYSFEELSKYQLIYLAGFTYTDRAQAEDLILRLSEAGVKIVIAADGIPEDRSTHDQSFLGVRCNPVEFHNGYPELDTVDGRLNVDLFPPEYENWETVFLTGLDDVWGSLHDNGLKLDFYGTVRNENIVVIGINLTRFYGLTNDQNVEKLLSRAMTVSSRDLPERRIVPLTILNEPNRVTVVSKENHVNTSLAFHDSFVSSQPILEKNHLTYVEKGTTVIDIVTPYFVPGLCVSALGALLAVLFTLRRALAQKREKQLEEREKKNETCIDNAPEHSE